LIVGERATIVAIGPIVGTLLAPLRALPPAQRPSVWSLSELPIDTLPQQLLGDIERSGHLMVVEEHVAHGGAGALIAHQLLLHGRAPTRFSHRCAQGYVSGRYGSQAFHRRESGLDAESVLGDLTRETP
jgi:transketolase